jgi:NitT/TauT family transport system permease protein
VTRPSGVHGLVAGWDTLVPLVIILIAWQVGTTVFPDSKFFFSSPANIFSALWDLTLSGELIRHAAITIFETIAGFAIGTSLGAALGLALWYWPSAARIGSPYVTAISAVPVFAVAPVVIVWFGIGIFSKIMVAVLATLFVAIMQAHEGARKVEERHLRLITMLGGTRRQAFWKVVVPSALQWVVNSMRLNVGFAMTGAFIGEFISSEQGLGFFILRSASLYDMARVLAGCIVLMATALLLNRLVSIFEIGALGRREVIK